MAASWEPADHCATLKDLVLAVGLVVVVAAIIATFTLYWRPGTREGTKCFGVCGSRGRSMDKSEEVSGQGWEPFSKHLPWKCSLCWRTVSMCVWSEKTGCSRLRKSGSHRTVQGPWRGPFRGKHQGSKQPRQWSAQTQAGSWHYVLHDKQAPFAWIHFGDLRITVKNKKKLQKGSNAFGCSNTLLLKIILWASSSSSTKKLVRNENLCPPASNLLKQHLYVSQIPRLFMYIENFEKRDSSN